MKNLFVRFRMSLAAFMVKLLCDSYQQYVVGQALMTRTANLPEVRKRFIEQFGANRNDRTSQQWRNLIAAYGIETVAKIENMTVQTVRMRSEMDLRKQNFNNLKRALRAAK